MAKLLDFCVGSFFFIKQHIGPSKEARILGLIVYALRDWAWFVAAKLG